jgi:predicted SprT family Zn-dependent metalloprotease
VHNSREQLTSFDLHCSCSKRLSRMTAVEYRAATADDDETAIYECARCGKRTMVVHSPKALMFMGYD